MRKTFVLGKLAGTTSRILLLEGAAPKAAPVRPALAGTDSTPAATAAEPSTVH
jgi:hypothetical protein